MMYYTKGIKKYVITNTKVNTTPTPNTTQPLNKGQRQVLPTQLLNAKRVGEVAICTTPRENNPTPLEGAKTDITNLIV